MTITAFDVVAITAIAMFSFRDSGVVISIFADAIATMPPNEPDTSKVILYVEIGLIAELNFIDGYFRVEASLAPTSFLLVPQCHLTGGFALAYWFGVSLILFSSSPQLTASFQNNPNAGDWVFSIGGYHRAYTPPAYYPVPGRIGISFQIGDNIQMTGQSYFAITPKVVMAGALIHVTLSVGPVSAYLDATFDALINFHPLHYIVEFSISVGVECDIDIWFIHIHISVHIGADLHIEGPSFRGVAQYVLPGGQTDSFWSETNLLISALASISGSSALTYISALTPKGLQPKLSCNSGRRPTNLAPAPRTVLTMMLILCRPL
jgi:hypothetical protein